MVSNFTADFTLDLASQQYGSSIHVIIATSSYDPPILFLPGTIDPLVPLMITSHLFLSAFSCTVGIFIGFLVYRCYISKRAQQTTTGLPEPVYTEIALSANEAYGTVNP